MFKPYYSIWHLGLIMIMYSVYNQLKYFSQIHVNTQMLHDDFGINNK